MTAVLLVLAVVGWLLSSFGAVVSDRAATRLDRDADGTYAMSGSRTMGRWATTMIVGGATLGAVGTMLAVLVTD